MMNKKKSDFLSQFSICTIIFLYFVVSVCISKVDATTEADEEIWESSVGPFVPKDQRRSLVSTEYGEISAIKLNAGTNGTYHLQFITLEPNALFLPVILNADMVIYVQTGSGRVTWIHEDGDENEENEVILASGKRRRGVEVIQRGDVYRMPRGTVFFIQSSSEPETHKLQICAIFASSEDSVIGPYSSIRDMVLGFDKKILQAAFQVPEEIVEEITAAKKPPAIVQGVPTSVKTLSEVEAKLIEVFFGRKYYTLLNINKKKKDKEKKSKEKKSSSSSIYNILNGDRDVQNCNGWISTVTTKQLKSLRGSNIGIFMVNLSKAAMMGPHWNPMATEIGIVLEGQGVVHAVCPSSASGTECKAVTRVMVKEGDVFVVPRFYPAAQISFNNGSFVFVGFTTTNRKNHQFLAGSRSILQTLEKQVLAVSFNVSNSTIGGLLTPQHESVILECISCAKEEEGLVQEEIEKAKEEARKKEEEKRKQEEEDRKKEEEKKRKEEEKERIRKEAAHEKEATRQQEEFWHGGPTEGSNFWEKMRTG